MVRKGCRSHTAWEAEFAGKSEVRAGRLSTCWLVLWGPQKSLLAGVGEEEHESTEQSRVAYPSPSQGGRQPPPPRWASQRVMLLGGRGLTTLQDPLLPSPFFEPVGFLGSLPRLTRTLHFYFDPII